MGSMMKADSERRELVRERRQARIERKQERRDARERKRSQIVTLPPGVSALQRAAQEQVDAAVDRVVSEALARHDHVNAPQAALRTVDAPPVGRWQAGPARPAADSSSPDAGSGAVVTVPRTHGAAAASPRRPRRESDIAAFRDRRQQAAEEARAEARDRIARTGEPACVADALAALAHPGAADWCTEWRELEEALEGGRIVEVGAAARRALWSISRDAARTSRRARRDPDLALAACVAYAIVARLPRCALRSAQRNRPAPRPRSTRPRPFWR
jgi:hypothetical protein